MKSLASFADLIPVLDAALTHGGARFTLDSKGAAVRWIQRANQARKLKLELEAERLKGIPGMSPSSPWDTLVISRVNDNEVEIRIRKPIPNLYTLDGTPIELGKSEAQAADDALLDNALKLAIGLE